MKTISKKPNIAIVGIGRWGKTLLREFNYIANVKSCFHHENLENEKWLQNNYPKIKVAASPRDIFGDPDIDAVVIATPINSHYDLAKAALEARKHVFVEKPVTKTEKEARELFLLAEEKGLALFAGYTFLYSPVFKKIQKILEKEKLQHIEFMWNKFGTFDEGILWNLLSHEMAIAIKLCGEPVHTSLLNKKGAISSADIVHVQAQFNKGISCMFSINRVANKKDKRVTFITNAGIYVWQDDKLFALRDGKEGFSSIYQSDDSSLTLECKAFIELIKHPEAKAARDPLALYVTKALESIAKN